MANAWPGGLEERGEGIEEKAAPAGRAVVRAAGWPTLARLPIQTLLKSNPSSAQILFALAGSTLFVAVFLGLIWLRTAIKKLGARNRVEAAHLAERKGWL